MKRIAVIGAGISGMAAAYYLSRRHEVWLFEREARIGGHTNTVIVQTARGPIPVDTGFIVFNERNYPNLVRLFAELGVPSQPSDMSFSVSSRRTGFEYSSRGLRGFMADGRHLFRPGQYRLFTEIRRFHRAARALLADVAAPDVDLATFLDEHRFSPDFIRYFLAPMASSIWSTAPGRIGAFPARMLARFFDNHGLLSVAPSLPWRVVRGGSHTYIGPLVAPYRHRIVTGARIRSVVRRESGVDLVFEDRPPAPYDDVVFACHGHQALSLLASPTEAERDTLRHFTTTRNETWLHRDGSLLPRRAATRASWNYHLDGDGGAGVAVTYHMNRLQSLEAPEDYCVTLQPAGAVEVDESKVIRKITYAHPFYTLDSLRAQERWATISGHHHTHYCGAYWLYGFHEDGVRSALRVARALGVTAETSVAATPVDAPSPVDGEVEVAC